MNSEIVELEIGRIETRQVLRGNPGDLGSLEKSIRKLGLLSPLIVDRDNVLIAGSRRLEACRMAGQQKVRAIRLETTWNSMTALDVLSDENLCRQPLEEPALERLIQLKKSVLTGKLNQGTGVFSRLKKALAGE